MPNAKLVSITPNYMELLMLACSKPYGNSVTAKGIKHILESGHLSVLEHCYASFEVTCSVRVLGQLTRHRHLSFTVKSARGSQFDKQIIPQGIYDFGAKNGVSKEKVDSIDTLMGYREALKQGLDEQDAAYFLPQGVETSMVITGNFRAWFEYLPKRMCRRAMPEHRELAEAIQKELAKAVPEIFDRNFMNCARCTERSCEFK